MNRCDARDRRTAEFQKAKLCATCCSGNPKSAIQNRKSKGHSSPVTCHRSKDAHATKTVPRLPLLIRFQGKDPDCKIGSPRYGTAVRATRWSRPAGSSWRFYFVDDASMLTIDRML